jgi:hypothetical protein
VEQVARQEEKLRRAEQTREDALEELSRLEKEAKDPAVRQAAQEALKQARGEAAGAGASGQEPKGKEPGADAVARLKEQLRRGEQEREDALDQLNRMRKDAEDRNMRDAAREALKRAEAKKQGPSQVKGSKAGAPKSAQGTAKGQGGGTVAGKADTRNSAPREGTAKGQGKIGDEKVAQKGKPKQDGRRDRTAEPPPPSASDPATSHRAGDLYLEELRKKLTPEVLKRLKWTDQQQAEFLKDARAYQQRLGNQTNATGNDKLTGAGKSVLPGTGARAVGPGVNPLADPLDSLHVQPPPEFRDAYRGFTRSAGPGASETPKK